MNEDLARLSTLIDEKQSEITTEWEAAACKLPGAQHLDEPLLRDHMPQLLHELSLALTQANAVSVLEMKSAEEHGAIRFQLGFDIEQVIAEFGLLRDVLQQFAEVNAVNISGEVNRIVNRVIDKAIASSLKTYVRQQTEEVERKRQEYLSFIVHDLKTPISAMATATHVLDEILTERQPPAATSKMLDILRRNTTELSNRVMKIINEESHLQALSAETAEIRLDFRQIDLWPIVETLKNELQLLASSRGNRIRNEVPQDLRLCADSELLMEVLKNLLSNALKYTDNGEITFGGTEEPDSTICWVRDTGSGIAAERINHIFDKRVGDSNVPESTGLGLSIVAKVMQLHGGKVHVESTPGAGSTFRMEFFKARCKA
jgi:two-component system, OmpR family, phosphate regulon sensor histidine kinase PhoR